MDAPDKITDDAMDACRLQCKLMDQTPCLMDLPWGEKEMIREGISLLLQRGSADEASELIPLYDKLAPRPASPQ